MDYVEPGAWELTRSSHFSSSAEEVNVGLCFFFFFSCMIFITSLSAEELDSVSWPFIIIEAFEAKHFCAQWVIQFKLSCCDIKRCAFCCRSGFLVINGSLNWLSIGFSKEPLVLYATPCPCFHFGMLNVLRIYVLWYCTWVIMMISRKWRMCCSWVLNYPSCTSVFLDCPNLNSLLPFGLYLLVMCFFPWALYPQCFALFSHTFCPS